ncbi:uncharacterized protein LOC114916106 [Cajanus cajan]|uniref:uncharacterized protein LOC114916106 n=1 Tax=Cajanus cajan TaxID=3821 RepID=UPI0010FB5C8E|nr:uncharacterized protein LOC114916106 [Cajanus cajan]
MGARLQGDFLPTLVLRALKRIGYLKMKEIPNKKTSGAHTNKGGSFGHVSATPHNRSTQPSSSHHPSHPRTLKMKFAISTKSNSSPQQPCTQAPPPPPLACQPTPQVHTHPSQPNNQPLPRLALQSNTMSPPAEPRSLKKRTFSSSNGDSAPQINIQPPLASHFNSQPAHDFHYESTPVATFELQYDSEKEVNEEIGMQAKQSKVASHRRSWLVDVIRVAKNPANTFPTDDLPEVCTTPGNAFNGGYNSS